MAGLLARGVQSIRSGIPASSLQRVLQFLREPGNAVLVLQSVGILAGVSYIFYQSFLAMIPLLPLAVMLTRRFKVQQIERQRTRLMTEFRELLESLLTSLKAGYAPENAFRESYKEMVFLFGNESGICKELSWILRGLDNHRTLEDLLQTFAARSGIEEITEFADVFAIAKRQGGNLTEILERTDRLIQDRMDVEGEIRVLLASRRYEQMVMDLVPFGIIVYIGVTSPGFFNAMYHNVFGITVMSACLAVYLAAFRLSERIMDIRV